MPYTNYITDLVFIVLFAIIVFLSAKKGIIKTIIDFISFGVSSVSSALLANKVSPLLYSSLVEPLIRSKLRSVVNRESFTNLNFSEKTAKLFDVFPKSGFNLANKFGLGSLKSFTGTLNGYKHSSDSDLINVIMNKISYNIMIPIVKIVVFVLLVVLITLLIKLFSKFFNSILKKIPFIGTANTFLGGVFGLLKCIVLAFVLCTVLYFIISASDNNGLVSAVNSSLIYKYITGINPLINYIK